MMSMISANPDDDFVGDAEIEYRRYVQALEKQRDLLMQENTQLRQQIRDGETLRELLSRENSYLQDDNVRLKLQLKRTEIQLKRWEAGCRD